MDYINKIICGNTYSVLKTLPDRSVNCVTTSPPYWGLRDYGIEPVIWDDGWRGSLGLEPTFELYIKHLCDIFDEVKRVLRKDGTCWVNLGDSYSGNNSRASNNGRAGYGNKREGIFNKANAKSLCLIPQRFAIEMVNRGWILRNTLIWHKPNCMPSSAKDRFTVDFEYVYFFVKSKKYWFEQQFKEHKNGYEIYLKKRGKNNKYEESNHNANHLSRDSFNPNGRNKRAVWTIPNDDPILALEQLADRIAEYKKIHPDIDVWWLEEEVCKVLVNLTSKGAVWTTPTKPFPEAHFAVYPEKLIEPMIKAGCPKGGIVLDPFIGAGTTAVVAKKLGRQYIGIEIKQEYIDMAEKRIRAIPELLFKE